VTRRSILEVLKKRGAARAEELAAQLHVTPSAIRQHLTGLLSDGLVAFREQKGSPGRPKHLYRLTEAAEELFPKMYSELTNELLDYIKDSHPDMVDDLFERRRQRRVDAAKVRLGNRSFDKRVQELAQILDEDGYLADFERVSDGVWRVVEHNCAILGVATKYGQACSSEIGFLREAMPDADIERVSHMMNGAHMCAYEVRRKRKGAAKSATFVQ
jgi:DeoR family transcriptional regulator, suf operon transcriptional repressor